MKLVPPLRHPPGGTAGLFAERPFGEAGTPADAVAWTAAAGVAVKPVVAPVARGNGVGGVNREEYAYQGAPLGALPDGVVSRFLLGRGRPFAHRGGALAEACIETRG